MNYASGVAEERATPEFMAHPNACPLHLGIPCPVPPDTVCLIHPDPQLGRATFGEGRVLSGFPHGYFVNQNLSFANFKNADLTGHDFTGSNLTHADFSGADLTAAIFGAGTIITNATFSGATPLSPVLEWESSRRNAGNKTTVRRGTAHYVGFVSLRQLEASAGSVTGLKLNDLQAFDADNDQVTELEPLDEDGYSDFKAFAVVNGVNGVIGAGSMIADVTVHGSRWHRRNN